MAFPSRFTDGTVASISSTNTQGFTPVVQGELVDYFSVYHSNIDTEIEREVLLDLLANRGTNTNNTVTQAQIDSMFEANIVPRLEEAVTRYRDNSGVTDPILLAAIDNFVTLEKDEYKKILAGTGFGIRSGQQLGTDINLKLALFNDIPITGQSISSTPPHDPDGRKLLETSVFNLFVANALGTATTLGGQPFGAPGQLSALESGVQQGTAQGRSNLLNVLQASMGVDPNNTDLPNLERFLSNTQCMLMSDLLHKGDSFTSYPTLWSGTNPIGGGDPYNGRILPVSPDLPPEVLMNMLSISTKAKPFFVNGTAQDNQALNFDLVWVYKDADGLQEVKIESDTADLLETLVQANAAAFTPTRGTGAFSGSFVDASFAQGILDKNTVESIIYKNNLGLGFSISAIDVTFEGTNPSTARNDVQVSLTIDLDNIGSLDAICSKASIAKDIPDPNNQGKTIRSNETAFISLIDLVTLPADPTVETISNLGTNQVLTSEYSPDYSRIRLKIYTDTLQEDCLIVDLAIIDHELKRNEDITGKSVFTINYRGYFEQSFNMPFNDAFTSPATTAARQSNENTLKALKNEDCSPSLIRKVIKANTEYIRLSGQQFAKGGFVKKMLNAGLIYDYNFHIGSVGIVTSDGSIDPTVPYVDTISPSTMTTFTIQTATGRQYIGPTAGFIRGGPLGIGGMPLQPGVARSSTGTPAEAAMDKEISNLKDIDEDTRKQLLFFTQNRKCFYLGDLMNVCLDCMYKPNSSDHLVGMEHLKLKFLVGNVEIPNPQFYSSTNNAGVDPRITISPLQIPIDMGFFVSWYHDNYVKKGIFSYPVGSFIRDLIEKLVNNLMYDVCFSVLLPDEHPAHLRTTFMSDHNVSDGFFKATNYNSFAGLTPAQQQAAPGIPAAKYFQPYDPFATNATPPTTIRPAGLNVLMRRKSDSTVNNSHNYCVIYQQSPSYFRQIRSQQTKKLSDDESTVTMYYGSNFGLGNYCSNVTFAKTDSPYLREARLFGSSNGALSLMSNVYDLTFDFENTKANTYFVPGNIINFILTDWAGPQNWTIGTPLVQSDPHVAGTRANVLGFGGYFIIKSVKYHLDPIAGPNKFKITLSTKFLGTDASYRDDDAQRINTSNRFANEKDACINLANPAIRRANTMALANSGSTTTYVFNNPNPVTPLAPVGPVQSPIITRMNQFQLGANNVVQGATVQTNLIQAGGNPAGTQSVYIPSGVLQLAQQNLIMPGMSITEFTGVDAASLSGTSTRGAYTISKVTLEQTANGLQYIIYDTDGTTVLGRINK